MKYTITINQKAIVELGFQDKLDFIDLAIFDFITDFMLCEDCHKINVDGSRYFWVKADLIIENLPLLDITTTRGINKRIDKLVDCALLERCPDNQTLHQSFYKVGKNYKKYKFFTWNENSKQGDAWNENSNNNNSNSNSVILNNILTNQQPNKNKEKEKSLKEKENAELFEQCWVAYRRKGHKKKAKEQWLKLKDDEKQSVMPHIHVYVNTRELVYQADFERYLKNRDFQSIIVKGNNVVFDPSKETDNTYHPITGGALNWNDYYKCYLYTGWYFDGDGIADGYDDDKRPDGAIIVLNNGRGKLTWNKEQQKWIKK